MQCIVACLRAFQFNENSMETVLSLSYRTTSLHLCAFESESINLECSILIILYLFYILHSYGIYMNIHSALISND